jgi:hypothetical protein
MRTAEIDGAQLDELRLPDHAARGLTALSGAWRATRSNSSNVPSTMKFPGWIGPRFRDSSGVAPRRSESPVSAIVCGRSW